MAFKETKQPPVRDNKPQSEFVRRFKENPFVFIGTIVILIIVIVAFVLVPAIVPEAGGVNADVSFGTYNKVPITYVPGNYFAQVQESYARYYQSSVDESNSLTVSYQVWRAAFEETVVHTAILQEMKAAGYTAPQALVDREVARLPQFQENGRFSVTRYRALDNASRLSLWREVQASLTEERYRADITGLKIPSKEAAFIAAMAGPERTFDMVAFPLSSYPDTEVAAYTASNPQLFRVTHLSKITISSSEREAQQILGSVKDGTLTFEEAAQTHSQDSYADRGGDMGTKMVYELVSEIPDAQDRDAVAALAAGEFSAIVKVSAGWVFFRAEAAAYPADTNDSALRDKIRAYMTSFERGRMEDWLISQAESFIALVRANGSNTAATAPADDTDAADEAPSVFAITAESQGLENRHFGPLPINYGENELFTPLSSFSVPELASASSNENFWHVAFSTPVSTPSNPFVLGSYVLVLYPSEERAADEEYASNLETAYGSYWLSYTAENGLHKHFLDSDKLQDTFMDTFLTYFWN
ncbi:hypothetical protein FACS189444_5250 [Spirochaetia bacterium]|nr:hypothetical protein FACS189444_5250 [Spirochaetia bacterium]